MNPIRAGIAAVVLSACASGVSPRGDAATDSPESSTDERVSVVDGTDSTTADAIDAVAHDTDAINAHTDEFRDTPPAPDVPVAAECTAANGRWECWMRYRTEDDPYPVFECCGGRCSSGNWCRPGDVAALCQSRACNADAGELCCAASSTGPLRCVPPGQGQCFIRIP